jgi:predicted Rossmann fold flavoprotein
MNDGRDFDVIVLGAGAAGLMCAIEAGKRGRRVAVLERAEKPGKKILISGGGRCNFTNIHCRPENFISSNPHFARSALARYTPEDFIALVEKHGIPYHEKTLGQLFCDRSAQDILTMLLEECAAAGVEIVNQCQVLSAERFEDAISNQQSAISSNRFLVKTDRGEFRSASLVVATGGLSIPKMGASGFGYELAQQFGLRVRDTRPGLVPLLLSEEDRKKYCDLAGVSAEVVVKPTLAKEARVGHPDSTVARAARVGHPHPEFREKMLITHRGLSGPAILQISSYWEEGTAIAMDLAPEKTVLAEMLRSPSHRDVAAAKTAFRALLPKRLAERWVELNAPARWTNAALKEFERLAHAWTLAPAGTEGYDKAEVTVGGVDSGELSAKTMEARRVPGLYFIGEVVDVTGWLGGFNFQWAWASGSAAGRSA